MAWHFRNCERYHSLGVDVPAVGDSAAAAFRPYTNSIVQVSGAGTAEIIKPTCS